MEVTSGLFARTRPSALNWESDEKESSDAQTPDLETHSMNAMEILRETVRIIQYNSLGLFSIVALLIFPVSAVFLSNILVNQSLVTWLTLRFLLLANSSGLPLEPLVRHCCQKLSETTVSTAMCLPLFITLLLMSKAAIVYSVDCTYSRKKFDPSTFSKIISRIWKRILLTYLLSCGVISGLFFSFIIFLNMISSAFFFMGCPSHFLMYLVFTFVLIFTVFLANAVIICNIAVVISILEDVSGPQALLRSSSLVRGQNQVGLLIFLGSTIGMTFIESVFENRVKALSYRDGFLGSWEGLILVVMYSFVLLIDSLMNTIFYFSCKSYRMETASAESKPVLEAQNVAAEATDSK